MNNLATLKEHLEELFPGKWLVDSRTQKNIQTGIAEIDQGLAHGIARRRITEWIGAISSGKTTVLRSTVAQWCASGMHVVYVDTMNRLQAKDWAFVESGNSGASLANLAPQAMKEEHGKFWVVRNLDWQTSRQNVFWAAEQLIHSNVFDVVICDLGSELFLSSKIFARLQRSLERSRTALILLQDHRDDVRSGSWASHARVSFNWGATISCQRGISGTVSIIPTINATIFKEGMTKNLEVSVQSHVSNRLFTHPQIPDRRTAKT